MMRSTKLAEVLPLRCTAAAAAWLLAFSVSHAQALRTDGHALLAASTAPENVADAAQMSLAMAASSAVSTHPEEDAALPDEPGALFPQTQSTAGQTPAERAQQFPSPGVAPTRQQVRAERIASLHLKYIPAGWRVLPLTRHDKVLLGLKDLYNPFTVGTIVVSAGYSHLANGQPNFGTDGDAFAERFGAAYARDTSEGILTDAVFAPLLKEDPRYYVEGPDHGIVHRTLYAITRPMVTRSDNGRPVLNSALLLGYAGASALTYTYYPPDNRNFDDIASTFGAALGGATLGDAVEEFAMPLLQKLHLAPR